MRRYYNTKLLILHYCSSILLFSAIFSPPLWTQERNKLSFSEKKIIIETLCSKVEQLYPILETGKKTSSGILKNFKEGKYSTYNSVSDFIQHLNNDLEYISKDGHLGIIHDPATALELDKKKNSAEKRKSYADMEYETERWNNFGFKELKILEGNIGYLNLNLFFSTKYAGETAVAAVRFLSNCNALIIDLRRNGGGWDDMVTFLASYFINADETVFVIGHSTLDSSYYSSMPNIYVPGKKLTDIPIYILTSRSTASAAEAFTNIMRNFSKNTSIVGETTAGAENPVENVLLYGEYILSIPVWQKIYSYDKIGWEGRGIKPDIEISSDSALNFAHIKLLNILKEKTGDESIKNKYQWYIDGVNTLYHPITIPDNTMKAYSGKFGNRDILYENGVLFYQYKGRAKRKMIAISDSYFLIEGSNTFRLKFIKENSKIAGLTIIYDDGSTSTLTKE